MISKELVYAAVWILFGILVAGGPFIYGRFDVDHDEKLREASVAFSKQAIFQTENSFRTTRLAVDLALGVQWSALFCNSKYGFTAKLGWENHLFLDQNQMWRAFKIAAYNGSTSRNTPNVVYPTRGDLDTQGWTLTLVFDF